MGLVIEVAGESITSVQAIQSDSLYVFDQWCRARGQGRSIGPWQHFDLCQSAYEWHAMKSIKPNLALDV